MTEPLSGDTGSIDAGAAGPASRNIGRAAVEPVRCQSTVEDRDSSGLCPRCGAPMAAGGERDHRGVLLPAASPVGGIIIPA